MHRLNSIWKTLTAPHPRIKDEEEQLNSQLLSGLLVVVLPVASLFLLLLTGVSAEWVSFTPDLVIFGTLFIAVGGIYLINRLGFFHLSIASILFLGSVAIFSATILDNDYADLAYFLLLMTICGLFLPSKSLFLLGSIYIGGSVLALLILPSPQLAEIAGIVIPLHTVGVILILTLRIHRDRLETLRNQKLIASELRYSLSVEAVNDGVWDWNLKSNEIYFSPRWKSLLGYKEDQIENSLDEWFKRIHTQDLPQFQIALELHLKGHSPQLESEYRILHADHGYRWMLCRGLAIREQNGTAHRMVGSQTDISERKLAQERLAHDALHDALTGLPNRVLLLDRLGQRLERTKRHPDHAFAVLFIDLDRFKVINDSLGHAVGDKFLVATARIIQACLRPEDTISRLGGDEFAILLDEVHEAEDALRIADRIHSRLSSTTMLAKVNRSSTASIGIALFNRNYTDAPDMLRDADTAMYRAKALGGACSQIFDTTMYVEALATLQQEADLKRAVENQEWQVYYQPILSISSGDLMGVEALLRWIHPQRGVIPPSEFIKIAEETGLILSIGEHVLRTACAQVKAWRETAHPKLWVSVNISGRQFQDKNLLKIIEQVMNETGLPSDGLRLEITESVAMKNLAHSIQVLEYFHQLGIHASLDDFGNGYSSLNYLKRLPLKVLKIDRSFIQDMELERKNEAIASAIITLGHTLGLEVIAEGVETDRQLLFLRSQACDAVQGHLIGAPLPQEELTKVLKDSQPLKFPVQLSPGLRVGEWASRRIRGNLLRC